MERLGRATQVARAAHAGQVRKFSGDEYVQHPLRVAAAAHKIGLSSDAVVAAVLHDVVEDSDVGLDELAAEFGDEVAAMVRGLTNAGARGVVGNRAARKAADRLWLAWQSSEVQSVKLLDMADNLAEFDMADGFAGQLLAEQRALADVLDDAAELASFAFEAAFVGAVARFDAAG